MAKILAGLLIAVLLISIGAAANLPPTTPAITGPSVGSVGIACQYTAIATDPNGNQIRYKFAWGDGTTSYTGYVPSGTITTISKTWATTGTKLVSAQANDNVDVFAKSAFSSKLTTIISGSAPPANTAPAAPSVPTGQLSGVSGTSYGYFTKATDPEGNQVKYTFSWGDGTTTTTGLIDSGTSATGSHAWTVASGTSKTFQVAAIATDALGLSSGSSSALAVTIACPSVPPANHVPAKASIPSGTLAGYTGINYKYYTYASDPDGDQVKYTFDWGDGTASTTAFVASGTQTYAMHTWNVAPGTRQVFDVRAKATDSKGAVGPWSITQTVVIVAEALNHPPTIPSKPVGPTSGIMGTSYSYSTSSTDADGNYIKYIFDWGDGTSETNYVPSGQVVTMSHVWTHVLPGQTRTYNVRVASADSKYALCADWSAPLVVAIKG